MSERTLREALREIAEAAPYVDLAGGAWQEAIRRRRQRVVRLVSVAALVVVAGLGVSVVDLVSHQAPAPPGHHIRVKPVGPDALVDHHPVWVSPTLAEEARLPLTQTSFPPTIDLAGGLLDADDGLLHRAVAAFSTATPGGRLTKVWLVNQDGNAFVLGAPAPGTTSADPFAPYPGPGGALPSFTASSLSPDGSRLVLLVRGGFAVYDISERSWTVHREIPLGRDAYGFRWWDDGHLAVGGTVVDVETGAVATARTQALPDHSGFAVTTEGVPRSSPDDTNQVVSGTVQGTPSIGYDEPTPALVVEGSSPALLVMKGPGRHDVVPAAGWLDSETVVYSSRTAARLRLVGWNIRTGVFQQVSTVVPSQGVTGSYADLSQP